MHSCIAYQFATINRHSNYQPCEELAIPLLQRRKTVLVRRLVGGGGSCAGGGQGRGGWSLAQERSNTQCDVVSKSAQCAGATLCALRPLPLYHAS